MSRSRPGMAALWAVVVLAVLAAFTAAATRQFALLRLTVDQRETHLQATWLARSGIEVAIARSVADATYSGEKLQLPGGECETLSGLAPDGLSELVGGVQ